MEAQRGIAVFVLRPAEGHRTEVLLLERAFGDRPGTWSPVAGHVEADETQAEAALRELAEETGIEPLRFYAAPFSGRYEPAPGEPGGLVLIGIFVARVAAETVVVLDGENTDSAWLSHDEARDRLPLAEQRAALDGVWEHFVRRPPDEALRLA